MSIIVEGTVTAVGRLELDGALAPGRVRIVVAPLPADTIGSSLDPLLMRIQAIRELRESLGIPARSVEEVEAERDLVRDEWEERLEELDECRRGGDPYRKYREAESP